VGAAIWTRAAVFSAAAMQQRSHRQPRQRLRQCHLQFQRENQQLKEGSSVGAAMLMAVFSAAAMRSRLQRRRPRRQRRPSRQRQQRAVCSVGAAIWTRAAVFSAAAMRS
jgi:hypothetical protein